MDTDSPANAYCLDKLQKTALSLMAVLTLLTFVGANLQAVLWQSSDWLVSTVLPATVVDLTNKERSGLKQALLQRNAVLDAAATLKAKDMAKNEYFSHFSPAGVSPWYWFKEAGYVYAHAGENLAIHFTDSSEVVEAWMNSPTHRENIVNGTYTEIGVGTAKGMYEGYDTVYVVQLFGSPGVAPARVVSTAQESPATPLQETVATPQVAAAQSDSFVAAAPETADERVVSAPQSTEPTPVPTPTSTKNPAPVAAATAEPVTTEKTTQDNTSQPISRPVEGSVVVTREPVELVVEPETVINQEVMVIESPLISTSSGLAVADITADNYPHAGATTLASIITKPNALLQFIYFGLAIIVFLLLTAALVLEAKKLRLVQVAYSVLLLFAMSGLWFLNSILTSGAVIT